MIFFTALSLLKLKQRGILKSLVIATIRNPEYILDGKAGKKIAIKTVGKNKLKVIFTTRGKHIIVITEYFLNQ